MLTIFFGLFYLILILLLIISVEQNVLHFHDIINVYNIEMWKIIELIKINLKIGLVYSSSLLMKKGYRSCMCILFMCSIHYITTTTSSATFYIYINNKLPYVMTQKEKFQNVNNSVATSSKIGTRQIQNRKYFISPTKALYVLVDGQLKSH